MDTVVVLQELRVSPTLTYKSGQLVDATGWPNLRALIATRRVRERTAAEAAADSQVKPIRGQKG
jgi:hypothetical protein